MLVGVIADTHGLLRARAVEALQDCALIIHAGDVGAPDVLDSLRAVAPVHAVRGAADRGRWAQDLPEAVWVQAGEARLFVVHQLAALEPEALGDSCAAVVYGDTHKPSAEYRASVLYLNPGSAGPRRLRLPVTIARMRVRDTMVLGYEIVDVG